MGWMCVCVLMKLTRHVSFHPSTVHDAGLQHRAHQVRGHHGGEEVNVGGSDRRFELGTAPSNFDVVFVALGACLRGV